MTKTTQNVWDLVGKNVLNHVKVHLLTHYVSDIILFFRTPIDGLVRKYSRHLPPHVVDSEIDDLRTVAQLEFLETVKIWDPEINENIWPLAYQRIVGAMKDHIRYVTRSDPARIYDWMTEAAEMYITVEERSDFVYKFDNGDQLNRAMTGLSDRERHVVLQHTRGDLTFKVIGDQMGISESQISRIYKKAIEKLKKELEK